MRLARVLAVGWALSAMVAGAAAQEPPQVYNPGEGVTAPRLVKETKPTYTRDAMRARIQGTVMMAAIVERDGSVGSVEILKSLDTEFGLDDQAINAVKEWTFKPGTKDGKPVRVRCEIEMTFTLRK